MEFTHFDKNNNAIMVDVSEKFDTVRVAVAKGSIKVNAECFAMIKTGQSKKGDVLNVARIAGIMGTKRCPDLIPLCHSISLTNVSVDFELKEDSSEVIAICETKTTGKTGVEMEALTGASVALLTIYDMCKAVDKRMVIGDIHLERKTGGKSGDFEF